MVRRAKFERGDIVRVSLNPTVGREQQGDFRLALVLSPAAFNALGVALVAPITQGGELARFAGFAVPLCGSGAETQGVALVNMARTWRRTACVRSNAHRSKWLRTRWLGFRRLSSEENAMSNEFWNLTYALGNTQR
ncbi:mRNA-degrading endonuclease toxin of MazEF toxin-antitoxin module [Mycetohabitans endofungorum]|uniref:mRNA-degrading endonuclease toxin of MazEF toxin-antitoxin module n=1 Tax=Mycetohabitans endofungorum TaxID=417203 RepID=A0A2P5K7D5_9BURK|nr:mRNA-degrading endonuclease toxin of MazEF toxin-antitoxin module [Mycetohabitans endofungorum]